MDFTINSGLAAYPKPLEVAVSAEEQGRGFVVKVTVPHARDAGVSTETFHHVKDRTALVHLLKDAYKPVGADRQPIEIDQLIPAHAFVALPGARLSSIGFAGGANVAGGNHGAGVAGGKEASSPPPQASTHQLMLASERLHIQVSEPPTAADKQKLKTATLEAQRFLTMRGSPVSPSGVWDARTEFAYDQFLMSQSFTTDPGQAVANQVQRVIGEQPLAHAEVVQPWQDMAVRGAVGHMYTAYTDSRQTLVAARQTALGQGNFALANGYGEMVNALDNAAAALQTSHGFEQVDDFRTELFNCLKLCGKTDTQAQKTVAADGHLPVVPMPAPAADLVAGLAH